MRKFTWSLRAAVISIFVLQASWVHAEEEGVKDEPSIEEILVVAHPLSAEGLSQASIVLSGDALSRKLGTNIGSTLAQEPGIHSAHFGAAVGRPVIHGLGGPRVRIMEDRIDALDVSVTSTDHAVTIEPFIADRVEVLKGPSTLLYGSGAIGGVVDIHTGRIPHRLNENVVSGGIETRFDENTDGQTIAGKLNGNIGNFAWHLDGTDKDGDDYEIPGFAESVALRAAEEAEGEGEGEEEEEEVRGRVPGSNFDAQSFAGGVSYIADWGFIGLSVSSFEADYGLPGGHEHEEGEEGEEEEGEDITETPVLELEQTRTDLELGFENPWAGFTSLNIRFGHNDYEHMEIEPNGEVATLFENDAWELRGEAVYERTNWKGAIGLQISDREFSAKGEEAFVPPVDTTDRGAFWVGERAFDTFNLETGLRFGRVKHSPSVGTSESFSTFAGSVGVVAPLKNDWQFSANTSLSSRAPVAEELFSNGPHLATGSFEIGDPTLDTERALNFMVTMARSGENWSVSATAYHTRFTDFIYEIGTGEEEDGLPVFRFQQDSADFQGLDFSIETTLVQRDWGRFGLTGMFDLVSASIDTDGNDNVPRIPASRYGAGWFVEAGRLNASINYTRTTKQDDVTDNEFETEAFNDWRAYVGYSLPLENASVDIFLIGKNLTDTEQRAHTSFIKEFAPAPGRTIEAGLRVNF